MPPVRIRESAGTVRGMHFQWLPSRETKLVRCVRGRLIDVLLDLRPQSPSYLQHVAVTLRYIELVQRRFDNMRAGGTFHVTVSTDVKRYHWEFAGRKGVSSQRRLKLRTPSDRGRYVLTVTEDGHSDHVPVFVR